MFRCRPEEEPSIRRGPRAFSHRGPRCRARHLAAGPLYITIKNMKNSTLDCIRSSARRHRLRKHPQIRGNQPAFRGIRIDVAVSGCRGGKPSVLNPSNVPQVRFEAEHAILHGDSVWVVVRATIPHRSIRRGGVFQSHKYSSSLRGHHGAGRVVARLGPFHAR